MITDELLALMQKVEPVDIQALRGQDVQIFGTGGYAKQLIDRADLNVLAFIDHHASAVSHPHFDQPLIKPEQASGRVVIGASIGNYQYNQLIALSKVADDQIEKVYLVDECANQRGLEQTELENTVLLIEHTNGVERHREHLTGFRAYWQQRGKTVVSLCPLMLPFYSAYWQHRDVFIWNGQRPLYELVDVYLPHAKKYFIEYGFFPQSEHIYFDARGVSQESSLMHDDLHWVSASELEQLSYTRASFLAGFTHEATDYVLVPLQVPDDANIVNASRFTSGMQEFIDYINDYYPEDVDVVFKAHPKDPNRRNYHYHNRRVSEKPFLTLLKYARCVHGITSSTLYEALLAGVEVISEGVSLINKHQHQPEKLLAAMVSRQIDISTTDMDEYLIQQQCFPDYSEKQTEGLL